MEERDRLRDVSMNRWLLPATGYQLQVSSFGLQVTRSWLVVSVIIFPAPANGNRQPVTIFAHYEFSTNSSRNR